MIELFKDRYKSSLVLASVFFLGVLVSLYQIYRLPHNLMLADTYPPALFNVYLVLGGTFLIGAISLWYALNHKNEIIVYRDKQTENAFNGSQEQANEQSGISLEHVRQSLASAEDALQEGLNAICNQLGAGQGALYVVSTEGKRVELSKGYALAVSENNAVSYELGEGLIGQAAAGAKTLYLDDVPEGYVKIISGLGSASPRYLLIVPIGNAPVHGILEIASFAALSEQQRKFVEESAQLIADKLTAR